MRSFRSTGDEGCHRIVVLHLVVVTVVIVSDSVVTVSVVNVSVVSVVSVSVASPSAQIIKVNFSQLKGNNVWMIEG